VGLALGPIAALLVFLILPDHYRAGDGSEVPFSSEGRATLAVMVWMGTWWLTEAIDIAATALLPLAVFPLLGIATMKATASPYANPYIFLFLGGFILARTMERWGLHRRIALFTLRLVGTSPPGVVGGFMGITAFLSMWISNTATTVMMLPIGLSVLALAGERTGDDGDPRWRNLGVCLMLAIAYSASVGGIATLVGTPPNALLAAFVRETYGQDVSFARWLTVGLPLVVVFLPIIWVVLTRVIYPIPRTPIAGGRALIRDRYRALGTISRGERVTLVVFLITAVAWITRPLLNDISVGDVKPLAGLTDPGIAILAALSLFLIPVERSPRRFAMDWRHARNLPWGILLLFGGGLSLAAAVKANGVAGFVGGQAHALAGWPVVLIVMAVAGLVIFLTEMASNTATTATLLPILAGLAPGLGMAPELLLVPATIAASCAFMMPVATPPNAIVFGSGSVTIPQMCRAGFWLNLIGILVVTGITYLCVFRFLRLGN